MKIPIGTVVAFLKNLTGTPPLPDGWVECNGQTLNDCCSRYHGVQIPDLNGISGPQRFLRGSTASGAVGGAETHNHTGWTDVENLQAPVTKISEDGVVASEGHRHEVISDDFLPSYYEQVWIMRVK